MAKQRVQVAPLEAPTTVKPTLSPVDIYTVPKTETANTQLLEFIQGITPALQAKDALQKQYNMDLERSINQRFADQEADQVKLARAQLVDMASQAYTDNEQYYLETGRDQLATDRNTFFNDYYTKLEESGTNPAVIEGLKNDLELVNIKFFSEVYHPSKTDFDNKRALNGLSTQLSTVLKSTVGDVGEDVLKYQEEEINNTITNFKQAYPNIGWTEINDLVRNTELYLSSEKDDKGIPRGLTSLSRWLSNNGQLDTAEGKKVAALINNNQSARTEALTKIVKTSNDAVVKTIAVPTINNLKSEFTGNEDFYSRNPKNFIEVAEKRIQEVVQEVRKNQGNVVADLLQKDLNARWTVAYNAPEILGKINATGRTNALSKNMDGVLQAGIYDTESSPEQAYINTTNLITDLLQNSGLTEREVNQRLVDLVVQNAAEKGDQNAINAYLVNNNIWQRDEYQDERKTLVAALKTFATKSSAKVTLGMKNQAATNANEKVVKSGGVNVSDANRVTIVDPETGNTTVVSEEIVQSNYEQSQKLILDAELERINSKFDEDISQATIPVDIESLQNQKEEALAAAVNAHADKKLKEYYLPRGQLPIEVSKQINNTAVYSVLKGQAGVPVSETRLEAVRRSLNLFQSMNDYQTGFGETAFKEPENAKRMRFLSILTRDGQMSLEDAIEQVQGPLYNVDQVQRITTKELDDYQIDIFGPFDLNPFSDVSNKGDLKAYFNDNVSARMATLGEDRKTAFDKVAEEVVKDFHINEYPNGVETAVLKRNTDQQTLGQDVGNKMLALVEQATKLQGMNEYITSIVPEGGGLVMRNNPSNGNMVTMYITDETGRIASPVASFSFDDLNNLPVEIMKERIARDAAEQLALTGSVTQEERDMLTQASSIATGAFGVPMSVTETDVATFAKAKKEVAEKRAVAAAKAALPYEQAFPEEAPTAQQVVPFIVDTLSQYVDPVVASNIVSILQTSAPDIEAKITQQRKKMSNRKAINAATKLLKSIDPTLVDTLRFNVRGLEGRYATKRGITVTEQASNAHALLATVDILKEQGITDFFPVR